MTQIQSSKTEAATTEEGWNVTKTIGDDTINFNHGSFIQIVSL